VIQKGRIVHVDLSRVRRVDAEDVARLARKARQGL
jgi:hypothetical protein